MRRLSAFLFALVLMSTTEARATVDPILRLEMLEKSAIPGQPLIMRLTVLVPTWMLEPPVFPSFEIPNVVVRVPSRGTAPARERVDGETWSGVARNYHLSPMLPGRFLIPADTLRLTFADPDTRKPVRMEVTTPEIEFVGRVPPGAEDMSPFFAAKSLSLVRTLERNAETLVPGDAVVLKTEALVSGVSPMFLPELAPVMKIDGLSAYAKTPVIEETENRGVVSGSRTETTTFMAEFAGAYSIPPATFDWYNLDSGNVETIHLPTINLIVSGDKSFPPPANRVSILEQATPWFIAILVGLLLSLTIGRVLRSQMFHDYVDRLKGSEYYAYRQFKRDLATKDVIRATRSAIRWQLLVENIHPNVDWRSFNSALTLISEPRYGVPQRRASIASQVEWQAIARIAEVIRRDLGVSVTSREPSVLPLLNPRSVDAKCYAPKRKYFNRMT
ncbi:BatD family protein [Roseibium aggregatum]|uniref:BatD family protein n=1 Tax=Roseibium aggregatum TaxID=187304 RepID=UPI001A8C577C|nr:BatD family protein [Roseibium aggregatum]MBN8184693.1 BatD family protein [Roseibium aggregatum]